jgi:hypothetical protein
MKKSERNSIIKWASLVTDEELENAYYDLIYNSLGSQTEQMYDLGYDMVDIVEQEKHEKYLSQKTDILETLCEERGIKLWQDNKS